MLMRDASDQQQNLMNIGRRSTRYDSSERAAHGYRLSSGNSTLAREVREGNRPKHLRLN